MFLDANGSGTLNSGEQPLAGLLVQLIDSDGNVVTSTHTSRNGTYTFDDVELGTYRVAFLAPATMHSTTGDPVKIQVTRGGTLSADFGFAYKAAAWGVPSSSPAGLPPGWSRFAGRDARRQIKIQQGSTQARRDLQSPLLVRPGPASSGASRSPNGLMRPLQ